MSLVKSLPRLAAISACALFSTFATAPQAFPGAINIRTRILNKPNGTPLVGKYVEFNVATDGVNGKVVSGYTDVNGELRFTGVAEVKQIDNSLPEHYALSQAHPNPTEGTATAEFSTPQTTTMRATLYNVLGQEVLKVTEATELAPGTYAIRFSTEHLPRTAYFLQVTTRDGITKTTKVMKGLNPYSTLTVPIGPAIQKMGEYASALAKTSGEPKVLGVKISGDAIRTTEITQLPPVVNNNFDTGDLAIDSAYAVHTITATSMIRWDQPDNKIRGVTVEMSWPGGKASGVTDDSGKVRLKAPTGNWTTTFTSDSIRTKETKVRADRDTTYSMYLVVKSEFPEEDYYNKMFRQENGAIIYGLQANRWKKRPIFQIVTDTTTEVGRKRFEGEKANIDTSLVPSLRNPHDQGSFLRNYRVESTTTPVPMNPPGYIVIRWSSTLPTGTQGASYVLVDTSKGEMLYGAVTYHELLNDEIQQMITDHELGTVLTNAGRIPLSSGVITTYVQPMSNLRDDFTDLDKRCHCRVYANPGKNIKDDKDPGWDWWNNPANAAYKYAIPGVDAKNLVTYSYVTTFDDLPVEK